MKNCYLAGKYIWLYGIGLLLLAAMFGSCGSTRSIVYMQGKFDTARLSEVKISDPVIQKRDLLSIIVYSDNPQATSLYNQSLIATASSGNSVEGSGNGGTATSSGMTSPATPGYEVDIRGNIQFQGLGTLHVEGLTRSQLVDTLNARLQNYLKNPYYNIRFLNYKFTILGEVVRPAVYSIPGGRISILEAFGLAGDMTFYGRRDNILVIREENGKRQYARLDITKPEIMASPYFYLKQGDVVIVEPTRGKVVASDQVTVRNVSIAAAIVSTLAILYSIFRK